MNLDEIAARVRAYPGMTRKAPLKGIVDKLKSEWAKGPQLESFGDDAAVIPWKDGYLLFAADGIMTGLLVNEPYAAGKASVMVTVNDIYAMGGRPIAMVNVLASGDPAQRDLIVEGIRRGCEKLMVPMVGGHLHPDAPPENPSLSVAILGWARCLLRSHMARPGDLLLFAADLSGSRGCGSVSSWDANSGKTSTELLFRLEAMPLIAEKGLAVAAKDVSNAGLLGTAAIMMENSGLGAFIDTSAIPFPREMELMDWLVCFQSFGFLLSVPGPTVEQVKDIFRERAIEAAVIGEVTSQRRVILGQGGAKTTLIDLEKEEITGISVRPRS